MPVFTPHVKGPVTRTESFLCFGKSCVKYKGLKMKSFNVEFRELFLFRQGLELAK